jgi:hypothetical protein
MQEIWNQFFTQKILGLYGLLDPFAEALASNIESVILNDPSNPLRRNKIQLNKFRFGFIDFEIL